MVCSLMSSSISSSDSGSVVLHHDIHGKQMYPRRKDTVNFVIKGDVKVHVGMMYTESKHPRKIIWRCFECNEIYKNRRVAEWGPHVMKTHLERNCASEP